MAGIFTSLNTSYTGLQAHQAMVDTTGNNIANANDEFYSRQKVVATPRNPLDKGTYHLGSGVQIESIVRAHDEFVFQRYGRAAQEKEFFQTQFDKLRETAELFPDLEGVGIYEDLQNYFDSWKNLAKVPQDPAQKQLLIQSSQTLAQGIRSVYDNLAEVQKKASDELALRVEEVNRLAEQIVHINKQLSVKESRVELTRANDLRDQRDKLEFQLRELIGGSVFKSNLKTDIGNDSRNVDYGENYIFNVAGGFNIIDGITFHPLSISESHQGNGLNHVFFRSQDYRPVDITNFLLEGKVGSLIKFYSDGLDGIAPGKVQKYIDMINAFAQGFIEATNNIYAQAATQVIGSDRVQISRDQSLVDTPYHIRKGSFDLVMYDSTGQEMGTKTIVISSQTSIQDVVNQINANTDDNGDQNSLNDVDDYFNATFDVQTGKFQISPKNQTSIYLGIRDNGSNFAGSLGISRFFDGFSADTIRINKIYVQDPTQLRSWSAPATGNTDVANMMQQLQYDDLLFYSPINKELVQEMKLTQYYQLLGGEIATDTQSAKATLDTKVALLASIKKEHQSISQVSVDEEMVNLIKFQSGYAANAKVVSTIDKMIDTLLGLKQ